MELLRFDCSSQSHTRHKTHFSRRTKHSRLMLVDDLARLVHRCKNIGIFQRGGRYQVNLADKQMLQRLLQFKVAIEQTARVTRKEFDQKINVTLCRVKRAISSQAEDLQTLHGKTVAKGGNCGAVLFDEGNHGVLWMELCCQRRIRHPLRARPSGAS